MSRSSFKGKLLFIVSRIVFWRFPNRYAWANGLRNTLEWYFHQSCFLNIYEYTVKRRTAITSYCSYARPAQPGPIRWSGPIPSNSVIKLVSVLFGKCTTLAATKCWPMETRLPCGDQWKAMKSAAFWHWPITRCFIQSDRARLIINQSINFRLNAEHWRAVHPKR